MIKKKNPKKGFSLIEIIVVIGIFSLVGLAVWNWQQDVFSLNVILTGRLTSQENLKKMIKNFVAEVRSAQPSATGAYLLEKVEEDHFIFFTDLNGDGKTERVRYFLENQTIKKGTTKASGQPPTYNPNNEVIINLVTDVINQEIFTYFDRNFDGSTPPLTQPVDILEVRLIRTTVTVDEKIERTPLPITKTSQVSIRNLKDNF